MTSVCPCEMQVHMISHPSKVIAVEFGEKSELFVDGSFTAVKIGKLQEVCALPTDRFRPRCASLPKSLQMTPV